MCRPPFPRGESSGGWAGSARRWTRRRGPRRSSWTSPAGRATWPGQHVDVRLTAEDGYQAQRSYSIASPPEDPHVLLTVERLPDGEVSPYLTDELRSGDQLELRGPIGGYFTWDVAVGGPLMLVAGGSGIVPLMAMLRHRAAAGSTIPATLLYSSAPSPTSFTGRSLTASRRTTPRCR